VDYSNVEALTRVLEDNKIHTLISALTMFPSEGEVREVELIRAADASKTTKRMISSEWGSTGLTEKYNLGSFQNQDGKANHDTHRDNDLFPSILPRIRAHAELNLTKDLEHTIFYNGFFLDYYALPAVPSTIMPLTLILDIAHDAAGIPGSGDTLVSFTHLADVAKLVAASLDLDQWDEKFYVVGDTVTWNEFLKLAEEAKGKYFHIIVHARMAETKGLHSVATLGNNANPVVHLQEPSSTLRTTASRSCRAVK
jgi:hypothetical protein